MGALRYITDLLGKVPFSRKQGEITPCPMCSTPMQVIADRDQPTSGDAGAKERDLKCPKCGYMATTMIDPKA